MSGRRITHADTDANSISNSDTHAFSDADANTGPNTDAHTFSNTDANAVSDPKPNSDAYADTEYKSPF